MNFSDFSLAANYINSSFGMFDTEEELSFDIAYVGDQIIYSATIETDDSSYEITINASTSLAVMQAGTATINVFEKRDDSWGSHSLVGVKRVEHSIDLANSVLTALNDILSSEGILAEEVIINMAFVENSVLHTVKYL